jgi:hypothetical protein
VSAAEHEVTAPEETKREEKALLFIFYSLAFNTAAALYIFILARPSHLSYAYA